jgi:SNF2 family DNA or RNA helicase
MPNGSSLFPYQREGILAAHHKLLEHGGFYLQWKAGMGKTLGAIALHHTLKSQRTLVVAPVVAQGVWRREFEKWLPGTRVAFDLPEQDTNVCVTTYDRIKDPKSDDPRKQRRTGTDRLHRLLAWQADLLILDEAQYVKSPNTGRTRAAWKLAGGSQYKLLMSGTPAHSPLDWWSQFRIISPAEPIFRQQFREYRAQVMVLAGPNGNWAVRDSRGAYVTKGDGYKRLVEAMAPYVHAVSKSVLGLPEPIVTEVPLTLSQREQRAYDSMETTLRAELHDETEANASIVLTQIMRLDQIAAGHVTNEVGDTVDIGTTKTDAALELIDQRDDEKIVVACRFRQDISRLKEALEKRERPFRVIDGSVSASKRSEAEDWFQTQEHNGVMLLNYQAGGVAITLSKASTIIMYTLTPSVIQWEQMLARVHRIGTTTNVQVLYLLAEGTHDELQLAGLKAGASMVDMARLLLKYLNREDGRKLEKIA